MGFLQSLKKLLPHAGPDYKEGKKMGETYAKEAALKGGNMSHAGRPGSVEAGIRARSFTEDLRTDGKSEEFIKGFYFGFQQRYEELISTYYGK